MCGICGVVSFGQQRRRGARSARDGRHDRPPRPRLGRLLRRARRPGGARLPPPEHCRPDARATSRWPNEDGSIWLIFNGEIYNHAEYRARLEARGHRYRSRSDGEVILHLYEEYGPDCVDHLRGMFAFALWDSRRRRLLLARDRVGIKPLYFAVTPEALLFGSEIKALFAHPERACHHG